MFYLTAISQCCEGFDEYEFNCDYADGMGMESELFEGYTNQGAEIFKLGKDELPESVADIRGKIRGASDLYGVYAWVLENGEHGYIGTVERDEE